MNTNTFGKLGWAGLVVLVAACGGDDKEATNNAAPAEVKSGVPPEKTVNSLSEAEAKQISASFAQGIQAAGLIDGMCTISGIIGEAFGAAAGQAVTCEQVAADCKAAPTEATESTIDVQDDPAQLTQCTVTVGELEACMNAMLTQYKQSFAGLTCDTDLQVATESASGGTSVAACEKVNTTCPTLLSAGGGASATP